MELEELLAAFFRASVDDGRLTSAHIGVYVCLLQIWRQRNYPHRLEVYSKEVMGVARISSRMTYRKCIRDLNDQGYIRYEPSFKRNRGSLVMIMQREGVQ